MSRIQEAIANVVHFRTRGEARNLQYSFYPKKEAFPGQFYPVEEIKGSVRGVEIDLQVLHANGQHLITGTLGDKHVGYEPEMGMRVFNRYARHLRRTAKTS